MGTAGVSGGHAEALAVPRGCGPRDSAIMFQLVVALFAVADRRGILWSATELSVLPQLEYLREDQAWR